MDGSIGSPWTRFIVGACRPGVSVFGLPQLYVMVHVNKSMSVINH